MTRPTIGCLLLGTRDGVRLRRWYRAVFGGVATERGGLRFGDIEVVIDERTDLAVAAAEPDRLALTFLVPDLASTQTRLRALGTRRTERLRATDPDGNIIHVVEGRPPA